MTNGRNLWMWVAAALLCTTIAASYMAVNYQSQAEQLKKDYEALLEDIDDLTIRINMKIDYGGGNIVWYNDTRVPLDANLLTATQVVASVEYSTGEYGAFVNKIDDVGGDPNTYWLWYYFDQDTGGWEFGPVACDMWILHNGDLVSWVYSSF